MLIQNISESWSEGVTLNAAEGWQCRDGIVLVTASDEGPENRGIQLESGQAWAFPEGATVRYKRLVGSATTIAREPIA